MKLTKLEIAVATAGALLDAPRFVDIGMQTHGTRIAGEWWAYVHGVTSGLFGLVMAASLTMCLAALSRPSVTRPRAYLALSVTTGMLIAVTVTAVTYALMGWRDVVFVLASVVAPILVIVNVPFAAALRERVTDPVRTVRESVTLKRTTVTPVTDDVTPALQPGVTAGDIIQALPVTRRGKTAAERQREYRARRSQGVTA